MTIARSTRTLRILSFSALTRGFTGSLQVGSAVQVRYSPSRLLRSFAGMGLYLDGSSRLSRLPYGPPDQGDIAKAGAVALAAVFGQIAYWRKNKTLCVVAAVIAGICFPVALVGACGMIPFPAIFKRSVGKLLHSSRTLGSFTDPSAANSWIEKISSLSQLPAEDPRRNRLEALLRIAQGDDKGSRRVL